VRYTRTMTARRVLITVPHTYQRDAPYLQRLEAAGLEAERRIGRHGKLTEDELRDALPGVFATLASSEPYTERVFRGAPELRVVARWGVGFDAIDVDAATSHGVVVCTAVGANHEAVADYAVSLMCTLKQVSSATTGSSPGVSGRPSSGRGSGARPSGSSASGGSAKPWPAGAAASR